MSGILQAIGAGTRTEELYDDDPQVVDEPVFEPGVGDISGEPKQAAPKYSPSVKYLETMTGLAVLDSIAIVPHILDHFISNSVHAIMAGMALVLLGALALCFTIPAGLRKSIKSKKHAKRKMVLAVALTLIICFVSWIVTTS